MKLSDRSLLEFSEGIQKMSKLEKLTVELGKRKNVFNLIFLDYHSFS